MKLSVKRFAALTGVSVRTLHYYDEIDLLKPDAVEPHTGYRYYGERALTRMQKILFLRELDFPLKYIRDMLSSPHYNKAAALREQKQLLLLKKKRLENIIQAIEHAEKGEDSMNFSAFDNAPIEDYKEEVKRRWGHTAAYRESKEKAADPQQLQSRLQAIFAAFSAVRRAGVAPADEQAAALVKRLQLFITDTQYTCTEDILLCLGDMYVSDERFRNNIDKAGEGTAAFVRSAIQAYCRR